MFVLGAAARGAGACAWLAVAGAAMPNSGEGVLGSESLMHEQHSNAMYVKPNTQHKQKEMKPKICLCGSSATMQPTTM